MGTKVTLLLTSLSNNSFKQLSYNILRYYFIYFQYKRNKLTLIHVISTITTNYYEQRDSKIL